MFRAHPSQDTPTVQCPFKKIKLLIFLCEKHKVKIKATTSVLTAHSDEVQQVHTTSVVTGEVHLEATPTYFSYLNE